MISSCLSIELTDRVLLVVRINLEQVKIHLLWKIAIFKVAGLTSKLISYLPPVVNCLVYLVLVKISQHLLF